MAERNRIIDIDSKRLIYHRCEDRIYCAKRAHQHPHSADVQRCESGWRLATEREIENRYGACMVCWMERAPVASQAGS